MSQTMIQVRVEKDLKERVSEIYEAVGLDLPTAIRMFFKKSILVGGLPFDGRVTTTDCLLSHEDREREVIRQRAIAAFESLSAQAQKNLDHEPTLDEINDIISEVRKERRERECSKGIAV